jgi:ribosomal-protein-alanine N-acetyltransferase
MTEFPVLTTGRLLLREFLASDAPAVLDIFAHEEVTRYHNLDTLHSLEEARRLIEVREGLWGKGTGIYWAITLLDQPERVIGSCGCYQLNRLFRSIEIGYDLHLDHWQQGIMSEALAAMLDHCFGRRFTFRLNRVEALTDLENRASIGLLKKLGFREEGIRRQAVYWKGEFHDVRSFSLLRRDWTRRSASIVPEP